MEITEERDQIKSNSRKNSDFNQNKKKAIEFEIED